MKVSVAASRRLVLMLFFAFICLHRVRASETGSFDITYQSLSKNIDGQKKGIIPLPKGEKTKVGELQNLIYQAFDSDRYIDPVLIVKGEKLQKDKSLDDYDIKNHGKVFVFIKKKKIIPLDLQDDVRKVHIDHFMKLMQDSMIGRSIVVGNGSSLGGTRYISSRVDLPCFPSKWGLPCFWIDNKPYIRLDVSGIKGFFCGENLGLNPPISYFEKPRLPLVLRSEAETIKESITLHRQRLSNGGLSIAQKILSGYCRFFTNGCDLPHDLSQMMLTYLGTVDFPTITPPRFFQCENASFEQKGVSNPRIDRASNYLKKNYLRLLQDCNKFGIHRNTRYLELLFETSIETALSFYVHIGPNTFSVRCYLDNPRKPRFVFRFCP